MPKNLEQTKTNEPIFHTGGITRGNNDLRCYFNKIF